jgi:TRAP-type C4-dicarboxylate transport system permease small subunit
MTPHAHNTPFCILYAILWIGAALATARLVEERWRKRKKSTSIITRVRKKFASRPLDSPLPGKE